MKCSLITFGVAVLMVSASPVVVFADAPTGKEPWSAAFMEANPDGVQGYVIKNLTNSEWQDGLNIWWRAIIPCGVFSGSGLNATWNRSGCGTIDLKNNPAHIAIFIENTKVSGREYPYPDHLGVPAQNPPEHLIVYAEYPEEGYKHGFGTSLLYYGYDVFLKYNPAKEGTGNTKPLPNLWGVAGVEQKQEEQGAAPIIVQTNQTSKGSGGLPWIPIALGVVVLGGVAYWIRSRLIGGDYGGGIKNKESKPIPENPEKKKERIKNACNAEYLVMKKAEYALEGASMRRFNAHDRAVQSEGATEGKWGPKYGKEYADRVYAENGGGHDEGLRSQNAYEEAEQAYDKAKAAYDLCLKTEDARDSLGYAPADYVKPEGEPEEPEVM